MFAQLSKSEIVLFVATAASGVLLAAILSWAVLRSGNLSLLVWMISTPFLFLAFASSIALWKRNGFGAWGSFAFFALQVICVERDGGPFWPGYNVGVMIQVYESQRYVVDFGVTSLVFALLAIGVLRQFAYDELPKVDPLLPPNNSLERSRER